MESNTEAPLKASMTLKEDVSKVSLFLVVNSPLLGSPWLVGFPRRLSLYLAPIVATERIENIIDPQLFLSP